MNRRRLLFFEYIEKIDLIVKIIFYKVYLSSPQ
jgi:hypothetical protein